MPPTLNSQLTSTIQSFVAELSAMVRTAALESVQSALGVASAGGKGGSAGTKTGSAPARRGPGRPRVSVVRRGPGRPKGTTRSTEGSGAITAKLLKYITMHDGKRLEEVARALNVPTAGLKRPAQTLILAKAVRRSGTKRGTMYHVGGSGAASRKPAKKA